MKLPRGDLSAFSMDAALYRMLASLYSVMVGSQLQLIACSALACVLVAFLVRPISVVVSWVKLHISPFLQGKKLPPGSFGFLFIQETLQFVSCLRHEGGPAKFVRERTARFASETFRTNIFLHPTVVVQGAAAHKFLASGENRQEVQNAWPASTLELLGKNAPVAVHGMRHRRQRQIMSTCLGPGGLQKVVPKADRITKQHFEKVWNEGAQFSVVTTLKRHAFRIACSLLAGTEEEPLLHRLESLFRPWIAGIADVPLDVPGTAFYKSKRARDVLRAEINQLILQRQQKLHQSSMNDVNASDQGIHDQDLLSQFIMARDENGSALSLEELRDITLFLLFAGHDTFASTLIFALKFLEQNPSCRQRLLQEHESIASQKERGAPLTWMDIANMKYTWAVLQETMRLRPAVLGGMKEAQKDLTYDGYTIPKGWKIFYATSSTHENDKYFDDSSKFDPSRFDVDRMQKDGPPPFSFVAFGIGPHACKGSDFAKMSMSLYIHYLIMSKYIWTPLEPNEKYHWFPMLTLSKGYPVTVSLQGSSEQRTDCLME